MKLSDEITGNARIVVGIFLFAGLLCSLWQLWSLMEIQLLGPLNVMKFGTIGVLMMVAMAALNLFISFLKYFCKRK